MGIAFFALFAAALNGLFLAAVWVGPDSERAAIHGGSLAALALVWVTAFASAVKLSWGTNREKLCRGRSEALRDGIILGLRGDHKAALATFEQAAKDDVDGDDADVQFHIGVAALRLGLDRKAERHWARCLEGCMDSGRFRFEIEREREKHRASQVAAEASGALAPMPTPTVLGSPTPYVDAAEVKDRTPARGRPRLVADGGGRS